MLGTPPVRLQLERLANKLNAQLHPASLAWSYGDDDSEFTRALDVWLAVWGTARQTPMRACLAGPSREDVDPQEAVKDARKCAVTPKVRDLIRRGLNDTLVGFLVSGLCSGALVVSAGLGTGVV